MVLLIKIIFNAISGTRNLLQGLSSSLESLEEITGFDLCFTFCKQQLSLYFNTQYAISTLIGHHLTFLSVFLITFIYSDSLITVILPLMSKSLDINEHVTQYVLSLTAAQMQRLLTHVDSGNLFIVFIFKYFSKIYIIFCDFLFWHS